MKKLVSILLSAVLMLSLFSGCSSNKQSANSDKLQVITTIFPPYDFARQVAGDNAEIHMMLPSGSESHSFEPTPQDITRINSADIFIYIGGDSDSWVDEILKSIDNKNLKIIKLLDYIDTVTEERVEGMEKDDHADHNHGDETFDPDDVKDRPLSDWAGEWQSVYPYLLDGTLQEVMDHKAEESRDTEEEKTAQEYYDYYKQGYKTDVTNINITDDTMEFIREGKPSKAEYKYKGFQIYTYESGDKGVRYFFEAKETAEGAPKYVQFSDHGITQGKSEHFHIYFGDESFQKLSEEMNNWPTYYPADLSGEQIKEEMTAHDHGHSQSDVATDPNAKKGADGLYRNESNKIVPKTTQTEGIVDEHIWTSPFNAKAMSLVIAQFLEEADSENAADYQANVTAYATELEQLDRSFQEVVSKANRKTVMFADRFPFRYFADCYGLTYYAAFPGCSTETDASPATVAFLIDKIKEENIPVVFHIEFSNEKMADSVCEATGAQKKLLHSTHNVTKTNFDNGVTYLDLMKQNVETLKEALQ